jgi:hypothetical protein
MLLLSALVPAYALECADPVDLSELRAAMDGVEAAWRDLDDVGFRDRTNELSGLLLPCVSVVLPPEDAARMHRIAALHLEVVGDAEAAVAAAHAGHAVQPDLAWNDLVPPDHELRIAWDAAQPPDRFALVPEPRAGELAFDGTVGRRRPLDVPTVAQVVDASGIAIRTSYLGPGDPLPAYAAIPRMRNRLLGCTGGAVALSGASYAVSWGARGRMVGIAADPTTPGADIDGLRATANWTSVTSGLMLGIGAGCGVGALLIGDR